MVHLEKGSARAIFFILSKKEQWSIWCRSMLYNVECWKFLYNSWRKGY